MNATQIRDADAARFDVPDGLQAPDSKLIYLFLAATGGATVEDLHEGLDIKHISLFPVLDTLTERGMVDRDGDAYVTA